MDGQALQTARKQLGLTQVEAAKKLGVSQSYLSMFEKGKRSLTKNFAKKVVRLLNLPPTALPIETEFASGDK